MRKSDIIFCKGEALTIAEWSVKTGLSISTIKHRLGRGWSAEETLCEPSHPNGSTKHKTQRADMNCVTCHYSMQLMLLDGGVHYACDYLGKVGKCRPCEYGDKCTVKVKRRRRKVSAEKL